MATEKQIQANRLNALKGGVKTAEGKMAVRLNAVTHGFFSKDLLIPGEDLAMMDDLRENYISELEPVGELETLLVERIVSSAWRLRRLVRSEKALYYIHNYKAGDSSETIRLIDYTHESLPSYMRYEVTLERHVYRAMHELERLQKMRKGEPVNAPVAVDLDIAGPPPSAPIGTLADESAGALLPEQGFAPLQP